MRYSAATKVCHKINPDALVGTPTVASGLIRDIFMSQDQLIKLACSKCGRVNYWSRKNRKLVERKIELKKYCKWCRKQTVHKEAKK